MPWKRWSYASSTPGYNQRCVGSSYYKCTSTTARGNTSPVYSSFLTDKYSNNFTLVQAERSNHSCSSSSVLSTVSVWIIPSCCSYCFYSVVTSVRHSPLLNTAGQCNLSVMILISVVTTRRCWTKSSTRTKVGKDGLKIFLVNTKR